MDLVFDEPQQDLRRLGGRPSVLRAFRHREFRLVWTTFAVGQFGFWIAFISSQALMARLTDSSGMWLGLLYFVNFIPMLVFTPFAGVVADRLERRRIVVAAYSVLTVVMAGLATLTLAGYARPALLLPFAFAVGTVFAFNSPANHSMVVNAVPRGDLASGIALQSVGGNLARVVGPTIAAPILAIWNEGAAFAIYAAGSLAVVVLLSRIRLSPYTPESDDGHFWRRLRRGFEHARERPPALAALFVLATSSIFAGAYLAMLPVIAKDVFGRGGSGFATLAAVTGLGSVIGALTTGLRHSMPTLRSAALLVTGFGASLALFALAPTWGAALVAVVFVGAFYFSGMTTLNTLLQYLADENMRGRISGLFVIGWGGLVPIGGLWQGLLSGAIGVRATTLLAGSVTALFALGTAALRKAGTARPSPVLINESGVS